MDDKTLADAVVALGVGLEQSMFTDDYTYHGIGITADKAVRDWRVAGALMGKVIEWGGFSYVGSCTTDTFQASAFRGYGHQKKTNHGVDESLPRAIIEACVEAING